MFQIAVGDRHQPEIAGNLPPAADGPNPSHFQHPQKGLLKRRGQLAHFIQQQGALIGLHHKTLFIPVGPGEGTFDMAKQLALKQLTWDGRAIDRHKALVSSLSVIVERLCHQFFPCPALATNKHSGIGIFDSGHLSEDGLHFGAGTNNVLKPELFFQLLMQGNVLFHQFLIVECLFDHQVELFPVERLGDVVVCTGLHGFDCVLNGTIRSDNNNQDRRRAPLQLVEQRRAVHTWHTNISDNQMEWGGTKVFQRLFAVAGYYNFVTLPGEIILNHSAEIYIVINKQNSFHDTRSMDDLAEPNV